MSSPSTKKPTILLVPGAWHPPSGFAPLTKDLESHGYNVIPIALPSIGSPSPLPNFDEDVARIRSLITQHAPVVILTHSYGGVPGSSACLDLAPGTVTHFIFCCSFAIPVGVSLMDALNHTPLPWFDISEDGWVVKPKTPVETFYNDITDQKVLDELTQSLQPHSYKTFESKNTCAVWEEVKTTYVVCEDDQAIPVQAQWGMVEGVKKGMEGKAGLKGGMEAVSLGKVSHTPFVSVPEELARIVRRCAGEEL